jgi:hypothetical protein
MIGVLPIERSGFLCGWCDQHFISSQKFVQFERKTSCGLILPYPTRYVEPIG